MRISISVCAWSVNNIKHRVGGWSVNDFAFAYVLPIPFRHQTQHTLAPKHLACREHPSDNILWTNSTRSWHYDWECSLCVDVNRTHKMYGMGAGACALTSHWYRFIFAHKLISCVMKFAQTQQQQLESCVSAQFAMHDTLVQLCKGTLTCNGMQHAARTQIPCEQCVQLAHDIVIHMCCVLNGEYWCTQKHINHISWN